MNKQQVKGVTNQVTGEIKKQVGRATGDNSTTARGHAQQIKGKLQEGVGNAREDLRDQREIERERNRRDI